MRSRLLHRGDQFEDVLDRRLRMDTMTEVKDVTRATGRCGQHVLRPAADSLPVGKEDRRIEVSLDGTVVADRPPDVALGWDVDAVVEAALARRRLCSAYRSCQWMISFL